MATNFPSSQDSFVNPTSSDTLDSPDHAAQHTDVNDAVEAIELALLDGAPLHIDDTNERVGVGTTSPNAELDIKGASNPEIRLQSTDSSDPFLYFGDQVDAVRGGIGMDTSANALLFRGYNNNTRMTIDSAGNVGINDTTPSYKLDVNGTGRFTGNLTTDGSINVGGSKTISAITGSYGSIQVGGEMTWDGYSIDGRVVFMHDGVDTSGIYNDVNNEWMARFILNGAVELYHNNSLKAYTDSSGFRVAGRLYSDSGTSSVDVLQVRNETQASNGSSTDPSYTFSSDGDTGIYRQASGSIGFATNGVQHYWNSNGIYLASGDWFRTTGQSGWFSETYGGGIYMTDSTWVRTYNNKAFYTPGNLRGDGQIQTTKNSTGNISGASINLGLGNGSGVIFCMNAANYGPLITIGQGEHFYVRNYLNSAYAVWDAVLINRSSVHDKQNIMTLGEVPRSAGSAGNPLEAFDAIEKVRQMRPVSYQWHEQNALSRMPCHEDGTANTRRIEALSRLNKIRKGKGLGEFEADYLKHQCGRDCEHTIDEPCFRVKNYRNGKIGFIAQEIGALVPAAAHLSEERDEPESIDAVALTAILTKAMQEIDARITLLEAS